MPYTTCPKCHYTRRPEDDTSPEICPACGLVFRKWEKYHRPRPVKPDAEHPEDDAPKIIIYTQAQLSPWRTWFRETLLYCPPTDVFSWAGRSALFAALLIWGVYFFRLDPNHALEVGGSFWHRVDLVFHEAGHVIFSPFGDFMHVLGGSLGQMVMPFIVMAAFLLKNRDPFGAAVALWWLGQSAMDVAIYINDARALELPLLGGGTGYDNPGRHDWHNLLSRLNLLAWDHALAGFTYLLGRLMMLAAWLWGGSVLLRQFRYLRETGFQPPNSL